MDPGTVFKEAAVHGGRHGTTSAAELTRLDRLLDLSDAALLQLCSANPDVRIERNADGGLTIMSPSGSNTGGRNFNLAGQLWAWNQQARLGVAFDSSAGFSLPDGSMRAADLAWVVQSRWDALTEAEREGFAPLCPDFVIELTSPSDSLTAQQAKLLDWIANGARLGWLIDPNSRKVWIYRPGRETPELLAEATTVTGDDDVLPGFVLDLTKVW
ncbi:MAG: Uma2 family endonuclease [Planctomycetota bacterium]